MFGFSLGEFAIIFIVALLVFGPEKMPVIARAIGRAVGELKRAMADAQTEINNQMKETEKEPPAQPGNSSWNYVPGEKAKEEAPAVPEGEGAEKK